MPSYKLRITIQPQIDSQVYRQMESRYFSQYVRCFEKGKDTEKEHYHYFLITENQNPLRQFIQNNIGKGNGFYSLKRLDEEYPIEYLSYLLKEDNQAVWCNIPDEIKENTKHYASTIRETIKTVRKEGKISQIRKYIIQKYIGLPKNKQQLVEEIVQYHLDNRLIINYNQILNYTVSLLVEEDPGYKKQFIQKLLEKIE